MPFKIDRTKVPETPVFKDIQYNAFIQKFNSCAEQLTNIEDADLKEGLDAVLTAIQNYLLPIKAPVVHKVPTGVQESLDFLDEGFEKGFKSEYILEKGIKAFKAVDNSGVGKALGGAIKFCLSIIACMAIKLAAVSVAIAGGIDLLQGNKSLDMTKGAINAYKRVTTDMMKSGISDVIQADPKKEHQVQLKEALTALKDKATLQKPSIEEPNRPVHKF